MPFKIALIPDLMLPIAPLPNTAIVRLIFQPLIYFSANKVIPFGYYSQTGDHYARNQQRPSNYPSERSGKHGHSARSIRDRIPAR